MNEIQEAVEIEAESEAWQRAWACLARDVSAGDTTQFTMAHAHYLRDGNGIRFLSVAFRHGASEHTLPVFLDASVSVRRRTWWRRLLT